MKFTWFLPKLKTSQLNQKGAPGFKNPGYQTYHYLLTSIRLFHFDSLVDQEYNIISEIKLHAVEDCIL